MRIVKGIKKFVKEINILYIDFVMGLMDFMIVIIDKVVYINVYSYLSVIEILVCFGVIWLR